MSTPRLGELNLHLRYKFTDRGGRQVFEIYNAEDNKYLQHPIGTIRLTPPTNHPLATAAMVSWLPVDNERMPIPPDDRDEDDPTQLELFEGDQP